MPKCSSKDRELLIDLVRSKRIFPLLTNSDERAALQECLLAIPERLVTINTLLQDTLILESPAKAIHQLCPLKFHGSLNEALRHQWHNEEAEQIIKIQISEYSFKTIQTPKNALSVCIQQLWLFGLRHFMHKKKINKEKGHQEVLTWSSEALSLHGFATLAMQLGFASPQISKLKSEDISRTVASQLCQDICRDGFYSLQHNDFQSISAEFCKLLELIPSRSHQLSAKASPFTSDDLGERASSRYNRPSLKQ
ncbi:hypothetical protein N7495_001969 [Penicillium taxi]|uniref:uncharacterized protein n=1 Tax=Penicillium taxi TaxID=168475 RepID=UPI0025450B43|nr:uncharacterized protein N7495_001969 [Penicillium taxi]KAJ5901441.1 hypothetical protein N7495_001969 [Penicillium taxi]